MKSSLDDGKTLSKLHIIWNKAQILLAIPRLLIDETTGDVIVLATLNNDKVFVLGSKNEGESRNASDVLHIKRMIGDGTPPDLYMQLDLKATRIRVR